MEEAIFTSALLTVSLWGMVFGYDWNKKEPCKLMPVLVSLVSSITFFLNLYLLIQWAIINNP